MLPRNMQQEALSRAYLRAVAARAGILCGITEQDVGIDAYLRDVSARDGQYQDTGPQLDVQLKSTTRVEFRDNELVYDLEVRAYNLLRESANAANPRLLVLLVLPEDEAEWVAQSPEGLILRRCAYWRSLRGAEPTTAHTTQRIAIPRTNIFSPEMLRGLMDSLRQGIIP